jgi:CRISPR-associated protein Csb2
MVGGNGIVLTEKEYRGISGSRYVPDNTSSLTLNVPAQGYYDDLERCFCRFRNRSRGAAVDTATQSVCYARQGYRIASAMKPRPHARFVLRGQSGRKFYVRWREGIAVAAWLRHATAAYLRTQGIDGEWIRVYAEGHGSGEDRGRRLSYVPVPSIGHISSDGGIRRALVVEPVDSDGRTAALVRVGMVACPLFDDEKHLRARLDEPERDDPVFDLYTRPATLWTSVTPLLLHGRDHMHGKFSPAKAEKLILQAFANSGYDVGQISSIWYQAAPLWRGAGGARECRVPQHLAQWPRYHVGVEFRTPVPGPVIAGIGRHFGLGLFAAASGLGDRSASGGAKNGYGAPLAAT